MKTEGEKREKRRREGREGSSICAMDAKLGPHRTTRNRNFMGGGGGVKQGAPWRSFHSFNYDVSSSVFAQFPPRWVAVCCGAGRTSMSLGLTAAVTDAPPQCRHLEGEKEREREREKAFKSSSSFPLPDSALSPDSAHYFRFIYLCIGVFIYQHTRRYLVWI